MVLFERSMNLARLCALFCTRAGKFGWACQTMGGMYERGVGVPANTQETTRLRCESNLYGGSGLAAGNFR